MALGTYTSRFNRRHKEFGHLFSGRYYGEIVHEAAEAQAQRLVKEGLRRMKWKEKDLQERRKGDARKVRLACELRAKTTLPLAWIAERLKMGSRGYLTWLLYRHAKDQTNKTPKIGIIPFTNINLQFPFQDYSLT